MCAVYCSCESKNRTEIESLRKAVRQLRTALALLFLLPGFIALAGFRPFAAPAIPDVITSKKFVLVNDNGQTLAVLQHTGTGAELSLYSDSVNQDAAHAQLITFAPVNRDSFGTVHFTLQLQRFFNGQPLNFVTSDIVHEWVDTDGAHSVVRQEYIGPGGHGVFPQASIDAGMNKVGFTACRDVSAGQPCPPPHQ